MLVRFTWVCGLALGSMVACGESANEAPGTAATGGSSATGESGGKGGGAATGTGGTGGASGEPGSPNAGGGGGVSIEQAPVEVAVAVCAKIYECCSAEELMNLSIIGGSESACQFAVAAYVALQLNQATDALDAGRLAYDGTALDGTLTETAAWECDMLPALEEFDFTGILAPKVDEGGECGLHFECVDSYCEGGGDARNPLGTCTPKKDNGTACAANEECTSRYCDPTVGCTDSSSLALCGG